MALNATEGSGSDFKVDPIPAKTYVARCVGIFDIGTQHMEKWDKDVRKVIFQWEIPAVRMEYEKDGEQIDNPRIASREFSLSLHKKALLKQTLEAWRGKEFTPEELAGFDVMNCLGAYAMLQIINKQGTGQNADKVYSNVGTVTEMFEGVDKPDGEFELRKFSLDEQDTYAELMEHKDNVPEWIWKKVEQSKEYRALKERASAFAGGATGAEVPAEEEDDSDAIPF
jgi:hypothetical protein